MHPVDPKGTERPSVSARPSLPDEIWTDVLLLLDHRDKNPYHLCMWRGVSRQFQRVIEQDALWQDYAPNKSAQPDHIQRTLQSVAHRVSHLAAGLDDGSFSAGGHLREALEAIGTELKAVTRPPDRLFRNFPDRRASASAAANLLLKKAYCSTEDFWDHRYSYFHFDQNDIDHQLRRLHAGYFSQVNLHQINDIKHAQRGLHIFLQRPITEVAMLGFVPRKAWTEEHVAYAVGNLPNTTLAQSVASIFVGFSNVILQEAEKKMHPWTYMKSLQDKGMDPQLQRDAMDAFIAKGLMDPVSNAFVERFASLFDHEQKKHRRAILFSTTPGAGDARRSSNFARLFDLQNFDRMMDFWPSNTDFPFSNATLAEFTITSAQAESVIRHHPRGYAMLFEGMHTYQNGSIYTRTPLWKSFSLFELAYQLTSDDPQIHSEMLRLAPPELERQLFEKEARNARQSMKKNWLERMIG